MQAQPGMPGSGVDPLPSSGKRRSFCAGGTRWFSAKYAAGRCSACGDVAIGVSVVIRPGEPVPEFVCVTCEASAERRATTRDKGGR
jgi:hypothetical protein